MFEALENVRNEIDLLNLYLKKIQKSRIALGVVCSISTECLERRSFRLDMDLTLDPAQVELINVKHSNKTIKKFIILFYFFFFNQRCRRVN